MRGKSQSYGTAKYYLLRVKNGESSRVHNVAVGIPEQAYVRIGERQIPTEVWYDLAEKWLRLYVDEGEFDPFKQPSIELPVVPLEVVDYWLDKGELPPAP